MIEQWNKELKRQGSRSVKSHRGLKKHIQKVAEQEVKFVTQGNGSKVERQKLAQNIDELYNSFPMPMYNALHEEYEKAVSSGVKSFIRSQK